MKEIFGDLWDFYGKLDTIVIITTNGFVKKNGKAVMGRGCALEAAIRFPSFPKVLGCHLHSNGNIPMTWPSLGVATFPVKHRWFEQADPELIEDSTRWLNQEALANPHKTYVLPRPGCGNGGLPYQYVKPIIDRLPDNVFVITKENQ